MTFKKKYVSDYAHLVKQWHPTKNGSKKPEDFSYGSAKLVWWKCPEGDDHEWEAPPKSRTIKESGCPCCSGNRVCISNNFGLNYPEIAKQWHPTNNGEAKPTDYTFGSGFMACWKCPEGDDHIWMAPISDRVQGHGCPCCHSKIVCDSNSFLVNYPEIATEWHPTKNGNAKPSDFTYGSKFIAWWRCSKNISHEWPSQIHSRTARKTGCIHCKPKSSRNEIRIYSELKYLFSSAQHRAKIKGKELDIYLPEVSVGIEYDEIFTHKNKEEKDKAKTNFFKNLAIEVLRVRREPLEKLSENDLIIKDHFLIKSEIDGLLLKLIPKSEKTISKKIKDYLTLQDFQNQKLYQEITYYLPGPIPENSFAALYPEKANEWMMKKNHPSKPAQLWPGSHEVYWWQCPDKTYHKYQMSVKQRTRDNCPFCAGQQTHIRDSLERKFPKLASEWDYTKNGKLKPSEVLPGSSLKVWWVCSINPEHKPFERVIYDRVKRGYLGCKTCNHKKSAEKKYKKVRLYFPPEWGGPKDYFIRSKSITFLCEQMNLKIPSVNRVLKGRGLKTQGAVIIYEPKANKKEPIIDFNISMRPRPKARKYINLRNEGVEPKIAAERSGLTNFHRLEKTHAHLIKKDLSD